jgi:5-dehydro-2-deoxygluconokinase
VLRLFHAARRNRLEFLLEVIPSKAGPVDDDTTARVIQRVYDLGVYPDWWKLEPMRSDAAWAAACAAIARNDAHTRGIVVLGLGSDEATLQAAFEAAAKHPLVKGFAVGRTIFGAAAEGYMAGTMTADEAVRSMTDTYARLCALWDAARAQAGRQAA